MAQVAIPAIISIGLSALASRVFKEDQKAVVHDDKPRTATQRGDFIPYVIGRARVGPGTGPVFDWTKKRLSSGGKGGGPRSDNFVHFESGFDYLTLGPAYSIERIWEDGKPVWPLGSQNIAVNDPSSPNNAPTGTKVTLANGLGTFTIYWGQRIQSIDPGNQGGSPVIGWRAGLPYVCYVRWGPKRLGEARRWPVLEYEITARPSAPLVASPAWIPESSPGAGDDGANPAHALWQLVNAPHPWGAGLASEFLDHGMWEDLGVLCEDEHIPLNLLIQGGQPANKIIAEVLRHIGALLPQINGVLAPIVLRNDAETYLNIPDDALVDSPEIRHNIGTTEADRIVYTYKDRDLDYRDNTFEVSSDADAAFIDRVKTSSENISTVISHKIMSKIADRLQRFNLSDEKVISQTMNRGARALYPGKKISTSDFPRCRVVSISRRLHTPNVTVGFIVDDFSLPPINYEPNMGAAVAAQNLVDVDADFELFEVPKEFARESTVPKLICVRQRKTTATAGANILISGDGNSYAIRGLQTEYNCILKLVTDPIQADKDLIQFPPVLQSIDNLNDAPNEDWELFADPQEPADWLQGQRILIIGDEWFYFDYLELIRASPVQVRVRGMIPARYDTVRQAHAVNDRAYIFERRDMSLISDAILVRDQLIYGKSQPGSVDVSAVTPDTLTIIDRVNRPYPVSNVYGLDSGVTEAIGKFESEERDRYNATPGNFTLYWDYRMYENLSLLRQFAGTQGWSVYRRGSLPAVPWPDDSELRILLYRPDGIGGWTLEATFLESVGPAPESYTVNLAATTSAWTAGTLPTQLRFVIDYRQGIGPYSQAVELIVDKK